MTTGTSPQEFAKRLDATAADTEALLTRLLSDTPLAGEIARPKRLIDSMRYSSLNGGKRLRPFLAVESAAVFGVSREIRSHGRCRAGMHSLLLADPRRPAIHGQQRSAPRTSDRA